MSSLINNLNEIYEIKKQIKEVAYIESDVFSEYPSYIQTAIQSGGATGTITITSNGTHSISTYATAYVNVPMQEVPVVPDGYTYVYGGKDIVTNGYNIDTAAYSYVNVQVPIPDGFIYPSGYAYVTTNGDFDIRNFEAININVPTGVTPTGTYNIITNGTWSVASYAYAYVDVPIDWAEVEADGYTYVQNVTYNINSAVTLNEQGTLLGLVEAPGYAAVELHLGLDTLVNQNAYEITTNGTFDVLTYGTAHVNVQGGAAVLGYTTITTNGTTYASSFDLDGFSYVNVDVPSSASVNDGLTLDTAYTVKEAIAFINSLSDNETTVNTMYVKGIISDVIYTFSASYPTARLHISDDGIMYRDSGNNVDYTKELFVYSVHYKGWDGVTNWNANINPQAVVGDSVVVYAQFKKQVDGYGTKPSTQNGSLNRHDKPVQGMLTINSNNTYDCSLYNSVEVNVPIDWAYVAACGYTYTGGGSTPTVVTWSDIIEINPETSNPEYIGPADGTVVQMTDDLIDTSSFIGQSLIDSNLISMISGAGSTDLANHLQSYIGSYLLAFANDDYSSSEPGIYIISDNSYVSGNATVTGPIYNLSPYKSGGIYWWPEIDACSNVVINSENE